ncbi:NitT/TauT family transport system permease protein [Leucobacter luti]|uniref:ABC transporter permease n=1 Tax=Leucobacter luti TaxID=340320 RepID=UPI0010D06453|nr:ABC transporter permease [Leucobacter luti]MCW2287172.1 NitT/TauT family transport system permease protein [Leucobacter luti]TCK41398.1 NitT/TauT family transport system permease protein [Leucobacter luti]
MSTHSDTMVRRPRRRLRIGDRLSRTAYLGTAIATFVVLIAVWWLVSAVGLVDPMFLPGPGEVLGALVGQAASGELWADIGVSAFRILVGFSLATVMAVPIGTLMGVNARIEAALEPLMDFIRYMPVVAFVPLTIVWVGIDESQKFLIIWMGTFFQQVLMVADAVRRTPRTLVSLGETLGLSWVQQLTRIVVPAALPRIWDALRITLGWAWTWLVVAELVAASSGMGFRITVAQRFFETDLIIGYVFVLGILGLILDQLMRAAGRRMFAYQEGRA